MKVSMLRKISIAIASLVASSTVNAAMDMDSRVTQLENQMQQVRTETAMGTYGAQTASARPEVDGYGWFFTFDVLYWHAKVGGTEFAYTDQDPRAQLPVSGRTKDIDFEWDWGLRVGLGYNFDHDGWDLRAQYTWFDTNGSDSTRSGINSSIVPLRGSSTIVANVNTSTANQFLYCTSAKSQYDFDYSAIDLELGRAYFISGKLSFRPHWGLKTAWIDQEQITRYTGGIVDPNSPTQLGLEGNTVHVKDDCDFWGLGPRVGLDSRWHLGYGFSIFGNVAGALLFGYFDVEHKERYSQFGDNRIKLSGNRHAFSPTAQMQLGLRYDTYIHNNTQHIGVGLGFEAQYWWRQNQMLKIDDSQVLKYERYSEDVSMHGITLDIRWDF
ncbi:MAG: MOMP family protein [Chlamydiales bacterium]|nr:MOMP family protein [Chlamydiales bacterium]